MLIPLVWDNVSDTVRGGHVDAAAACTSIHGRRSVRIELGLPPAYDHVPMLRYHVAFYPPHAPGEMVVAEALDFSGAMTQGFDLPRLFHQLHANRVFPFSD